MDVVAIRPRIQRQIVVASCIHCYVLDSLPMTLSSLFESTTIVVVANGVEIEYYKLVGNDQL